MSDNFEKAPFTPNPYKNYETVENLHEITWDSCEIVLTEGLHG